MNWTMTIYNTESETWCMNWTEFTIYMDVNELVYGLDIFMKLWIVRLDGKIKNYRSLSVLLLT